jgi:TRAP-type C4-dicarboxylate transport system permease small subunit
MDPQTLHTSVFYLLAVWGGVTAILLILLIVRSQLVNREGDQLYLDAAEESMASEQRAIVSRIEGISRPIRILGWISGVLLVVTAGLWIWDGISRF